MISSALSSLFSRTLTNVIGLEPISLPSSDFDEGETKMEAVNVYPELSFNDVGRVVMKLEVGFYLALLRACLIGLLRRKIDMVLIE